MTGSGLTGSGMTGSGLTGSVATSTGLDDDVEPPVLVERHTDVRLLVPALVAWAVVAYLLGQPASTAVVVAAATGVALGVVTWRRRRLERWGALVALSCGAVLLAVTAVIAWTAVRESGPVRELAQEQAVVSVVATVATDPHPVAGGPGAGGTGSAGSTSADLGAGPRPFVVLTLDLHEVTGRGSTTAVQCPVLLIGPPELMSLHWHEVVRLTGRLGSTDDPADDVVAVLAARGPVEVTGRPGLVDRSAEVVRGRFATATARLPSDARGLLPGLVIGDTTRTPADLRAAMQATGMTHLSAVSGSNVSFVLGAALWLCGWLGVGRRWRPLVALVLLLGFVVLVRPEPSVVRAAAMGSVGLLGLSVSRRREGVPALAGAVLALLVWDPWLARSFGFVLSTLATLGLLLLAAPWGTALGRRLPPRFAGLGPALAVPLAAQAVCGPVIVLLQGSVSVVGVATNLLAGPLVAPATIVGVATAALSVVSTGLASWLAWVPALPTLGIAWVARVGARVPWGAVPWPSGAAGACALAVLSVTVVLCGPWVVHHSRRRPLVACACGVLGLASGAPTTSMAWPPPDWRYVMCDVGQGDAMVLRSAEGAVVVVDAGPDPVLVDGCLARLGVSAVDAVLITHDHADHVDGLNGVLEGRTVGRVLTTLLEAPPMQAAEVGREASANRVPMQHLYADDRLSWPGITARVWWPARIIHAGSEPNNASLVLTVEVDGLRLLLLGDVEREAAAEVLRRLRGDPAALAGGFDVVKVAHHGSSNRDDGLYAAAAAPLALISVGAGNDYGHPAPSTVALLERDGFRVLRTDLVGDIAVTGQRGHVSVATQSGG